jgi:hypothetical protein
VHRNAQSRPAQLQLLTEALLSLNLALLLFYCYLVRSFTEAGDSKSTGDAHSFLYYFFRAAVRLNRILHYQPSGYEKYARWPNAGGKLGVELAFALTTFFLGLLFLTVLRMARKFPNYNNAHRSFDGLVFILAFPLTYVLLFDRSDYRILAPAFSVAIPELLFAAVLCLIYLLRPFSAWAMGIVLLLHYGFWALVYERGGTGNTLYGPIPPRLLLLLIPIGGAVWLYHCQTSGRDSKIVMLEKLWSKQLLAAAAVSLVGLGALWLPGSGYSLIHAKNRDSLTIEKWHSNCQGRCPITGYSHSDLNKVALRLNQRPRQTLGFQTPAGKLQESVASTH